MNTSKLCIECHKPGKFLKVSSFHTLKNGEIKTYTSERSNCAECRAKKAREKRLENKTSMKEVESKPKVIKPYQDLLGPSTHQMKKAKKIKKKTKCSDGWTPSSDNAPVAFGWCF